MITLNAATTMSMIALIETASFFAKYFVTKRTAAKTAATQIRLMKIVLVFSMSFEKSLNTRRLLIVP